MDVPERAPHLVVCRRRVCPAQERMTASENAIRCQKQLRAPTLITGRLVADMFAKLSSKPFGACAEGADSPYTKHEASAVSDTTSAGTSSTGSEAGSTVASTESPEDARATELLQAGGEPEAEINEQDENGDPLIEAGPCPAPAERGTTGPDNTTSRKRTAPSQTGDGQAKRRDMKRYREDAGGQ